MFGLEIPLVECPTCDGEGGWQDDDEDSSSTRFITCDTCKGEGHILASEAPEYEAPSFEEELDTAFALLRATMARRIAWHALSGQLSLSVRLTNSLCWSRLIAFHQQRIVSDPYSHETNMWAFWTIAQQGPSSTALSSEYLTPDPSWPGLHS